MTWLWFLLMLIAVGIINLAGYLLIGKPAKKEREELEKIGHDFSSDFTATFPIVYKDTNE